MNVHNKTIVVNHTFHYNLTHIPLSVLPLQDNPMQPSVTQDFVECSSVERFRFPTPHAIHPSVFCESERVVKIFNKSSNQNRQKLTQSVKDWFEQEAIERGWTTVEFLPNCHNGLTSVCVLRLNQN